MKAITLFIIFLFSVNVYSQGGWTVLYGGSYTNAPYYSGVQFLNDQTGYLMGDKFYKKTSDGGNTWKRTDSIGSNMFHFFDEYFGWIYNYNELLMTTNGGEEWIITNTNLAANCVYFKNPSLGFASSSNGTLRKTTDFGQNWVILNSGVNDKLNAIYFTSTEKGVAAGDWGNILTTTNGGDTWSRYTDPNLGFFSEITFIDQLTGFVGGTGGFIFRTENSGQTWTPVYTGSTSNLRSINFLNQSTGFAFGSFGEILKTTNSGLSWSDYPNSANSGAIYSASITESGTIWLAADTGSVYRSTNTGNTWDLKLRQFITYNSLNCVQFINPLTGFICAYGGTIMKSSNGGLNWQFQNLSSSYELKSLTFVNASTGFACGGNGSTMGIIYKSTNEGTSWQVVYNDSSSLNSLHFLNESTGWACGSLGRVLRTTNAGLNWSSYRTQFSSTQFIDIWFTDINTGYLSRTSLFKSTNGGINWSFNLLSASPYTIQFINSNTGYFVSSNSSLFKTTNAGANWSSYQTGTGSTTNMYFFTELNGWLCGQNIKHTTNGGVNWQVQPVQGYEAGLNSIYFINETSGWAVGTNGTILKTISGGIGIQPISSSIPNGYELSQNYPNPFNPATKIKFSIPAFVETTRRVVSLRIYDVLGKQIAVLVNEQLSPGTYEVEWNALDASSGVYFYSLITNEFTQTKKMVVLK